jgi:hypothetical protein
VHCCAATLQNTHEGGLGVTHPPYPSHPSDVGCIGPYRVLDNTHSRHVIQK